MTPPLINVRPIHCMRCDKFSKVLKQQTQLDGVVILVCPKCKKLPPITSTAANDNREPPKPRAA